MKIKCPYCQKILNIKDQFAGKKGRCPLCKKVFLAPKLRTVTPINSNNGQKLLDNRIKNEKVKEKRLFIILVGIFFILALIFRLLCGIFIIQPIGAIPDGATIVYWRIGLNLPFISSADGLLNDLDTDVSLIGRGLILATLAEPIKEREIFRLGYSEILYLWSTGGKKYIK